MGSLYQVFTDELLLHIGRRDAALVDRLQLDDLDDDERRDVRRLAHDGFSTDVPPGDLLRTLSKLLFHAATFLYEADHLRFDDTDFPELYELPYASQPGAVALPFDPDDVPVSIAHWPANATRDLLRSLDHLDLATRPAFIRAHTVALRDALRRAVTAGHGIVATYQM